MNLTKPNISTARERKKKAPRKPSNVTNVTKARQKAAIIQSIEGCATFASAAAAAGIDPITIWRWRKEDAEFAAAILAAQESRILVAKDVVYENALKSKDDPRYQTSLLAWLNNEGGWVNPSKRELSGPNGAPINPVTIYIPSNSRERKNEVSKSERLSH